MFDIEVKSPNLKKGERKLVLGEEIFRFLRRSCNLAAVKVDLFDFKRQR